VLDLPRFLALVPSCESQRTMFHPVRRPRASGDPEPAPGMNRGQPLSRQLIVKIAPLRIMALDQLQLPRTAPLLDALFAENRIGHGLVKLDEH
jgi:hypothetical protein